MNSSIWS